MSTLYAIFKNIGLIISIVQAIKSALGDENIQSVLQSIKNLIDSIKIDADQMKIPENIPEAGAAEPPAVREFRERWKLKKLQRSRKSDRQETAEAQR